MMCKLKLNRFFCFFMRRLFLAFVMMVCTVVCLAQNSKASPVQQGAQDSAISELLQRAEGQNNSSATQTAQKKERQILNNQKIKQQQKFKNALGSSPDSRLAFSKVVKNIMPLSTGQIVTLHRMFNKTRRAVVTNPGVPPRPTSTTILVNQSPGATPSVIRLQQGFVTTLVFLDSTGATWPIAAYDVANTQDFNVKYTAEQPGSLLIQSKAAYRSSNMVVMLRGNSTPVVLTLIPGQKAVDYLDYMRVPGLGPNASAILSSLPDTSSPQLLKVLDGVPPVGAKELKILGGTARAWIVGSIMYVRTRMTLLSPGWTATMSSPDGTHAYQIMSSPVLLASNRGKMIQLRVEGL